MVLEKARLKDIVDNLDKEDKENTVDQYMHMSIKKNQDFCLSIYRNFQCMLQLLLKQVIFANLAYFADTPHPIHSLLLNKKIFGLGQVIEGNSKNSPHFIAKNQPQIFQDNVFIKLWVPI